jgi:hypothetical protein
MSYYYTNLTICFIFILYFVIGFKRLAELPVQPCMHGVHDCTTLLVAWIDHLGFDLVGLSNADHYLCALGHNCGTKGSFKNVQTLLRRS